VLAGTSRDALGEVIAESLRGRLDAPDSPEARPLVEKERKKPLRAPVIVAVAVIPSDNPKAIEVEEIAAGAAAVENMLLAAHALGLGAMWRTGAPAYDPAVKRFLDLPESAHIISFVYLGYPDPLPRPERPREAAQYTTWLGWPETS
jgi:nitroreductase